MNTPIDEPVKKFRPRQMTFEEIRDGCITLTNGDNIESRVCIAQEELRQGMDTVNKYKKSVTMYGSARLHEGHPDYERARRLAKRFAEELEFAVITGGGPGIMEAANRGANESGGVSIGLTIRLPHEQHTNPYVNVEVPFYFFFTRKTSLSFSSRAYLAFPGGFGTFDEMFEVLTLIQTKKIPRIPIILVGVDFWTPLMSAIKTVMLDHYQTISPEDVNYYTITDDEDLIVEMVKNAPSRDTEILDDPSLADATSFSE